jgi:arginine repressor
LFYINKYTTYRFIHYYKQVASKMSISAERLDNRDKAILQYIKEHNGTTENEIVKNLHKRKISSKLTTLRKIKELKMRGEIKDLLKEGESGFHKLYINENNEFNEISKKLAEVEALLNRLEKLQHLINQRGKQQRPLDSGADETFMAFMDTNLYTLNFMLVAILGKIYKVIESEKDAKILYEKNFKLLQRLLGPMSEPRRLMDRVHATLDNRRNKIWLLRKKLVGVPKSKTNKLLNESLNTELEIYEMEHEFSRILYSKLQEFYRYITNGGKSLSVE